MPSPILFVFLKSASLPESMNRVLLGAALEAYMKNTSMHYFSTDEGEGLVSTEYEFKQLGSVSGLFFTGEVKLRDKSEHHCTFVIPEQDLKRTAMEIRALVALENQSNGFSEEDGSSEDVICN